VSELLTQCCVGVRLVVIAFGFEPSGCVPLLRNRTAFLACLIRRNEIARKAPGCGGESRMSHKCASGTEAAVYLVGQPTSHGVTWCVARQSERSAVPILMLTDVSFRKKKKVNFS
jgi:hypothetical protein